MSVALNAYLSFRDEAREAMEFYQSIFGGQLKMQTFGEFHASDDPAEADKIMHAELKTDDFTFYAADTPNRMNFDEHTRISLSLSGDDDTRLTAYFEKLSAGGKVTMPLEPAPWGDRFGMCKDQYGISWMVNINAKK